MGSRMKAKLVTDALHMAIWQRQSDAGSIVHSDYAEENVKPRNRGPAHYSLRTGAIPRHNNSGVYLSV